MNSRIRENFAAPIYLPRSKLRASMIVSAASLRDNEPLLVEGMGFRLNSISFDLRQVQSELMPKTVR